MTLYKRNKILFIFIALLFFSPRLCNAADTRKNLQEEILFITSYNSDTKYTYDNISTFIQTYTPTGRKVLHYRRKYECYRPAIKPKNGKKR